MAITEYTSTVKQSVQIIWKCSRCHKVNLQTVEIRTNASTVRASRWHDAAASQEAKDQAHDLHERKIEALKKRYHSYEFYTLFSLNAACKYCNHRESWSVERESNGISRKLLKIGVVLSLVSLLVLFMHQNLWFIPVLLATACTVGYTITKIKDKKRINEKTREVANLPLSALPVIVSNEADIENNLKYFENEARITDRSKEISQDQMFCRKCGKPIPLDSRFCRYCGQKVL